MNDDAKKIGDALDEAMSAYDGGRGISQAALARLSGVPQPTISRTLKGRSIPETETLSKLVSVLGAGTLGKTIAAILQKQETKPASFSALTAKIFALPCKSCGEVSHQNFIDLEANDSIHCTRCGDAINVAHYYGDAELTKFLESIGATGISVRARKK